MERLALTGFVRLIDGGAFIRLLVGLLISLTYLVLLTIFRPYKRPTVRHLATLSQLVLVLLYMGLLCISLFDSLEEAFTRTGRDGDAFARAIVGLRSTDEVATWLVVLVLLVVVVYVSATAIQYSLHEDVASIRLKSTGRLPDLQLDVGNNWHLFLSHSARNQRLACACAW